MGKLVCNKCQATQEADTFVQADDLIDHSPAATRGHPCDASPLRMTWDEDYEKENGRVVKTNPKPVASIVIHFGPESVKKEKAQETEKDSKAKSSKAQPSPKNNQNSTTAKTK